MPPHDMAGTTRIIRAFATATAICIAGLAACTTTTHMPASRTIEQASVPDESGRGGAEAARAQRQLIRRGRIGVGVADVDRSRARLEAATAALGAQVSRVEVKEDSRAEYILRVPPGQLEALMDSAAVLGDVNTRTVSAEDVTDRVLDGEARLGALRASRDRLAQLLERAGSVDEVISVERELARVQGEIESLDARLQSMKGQVAMSELSVEMWRRPVLGPLGLLLSGALTVVQKLFVWR